MFKQFNYFKCLHCALRGGRCELHFTGTPEVAGKYTSGWKIDCRGRCSFESFKM